jgi:choline dehydrogenase-like flavoprotein
VRQEIYGGDPGQLMTKVNDGFLVNSRLRLYGGTTNHWGFWARPLDQIDLEPREGYHPAAWPIDRRVLDETYPRANRLGAYDVFRYDDVAYWTQRTGTHAFAERPGAPLKNVVFHAQYDKTINHFQLQYREQLRVAPNVTVLFNCNVLRIVTDPGRSTVKYLECAAIVGNRPGRHFTIQADQFVLAVGGLEVTRLLLLSGALGDNARGDLGRNFMVHPLIREAALAEFAAAFEPTLERFYNGRAFAISEAASARDSAPRFRAPVYDARFEGGEANSFTVWGALVPTAKVLAEKKIGNFRVNLGFDDRTVQVNINWEQVSQRDSRITLHPTKKDPVFGQPVLNLDWHLAAIDKRTVIEALALCKTFFDKLDENRLVGFKIVTDLTGGPEQWTFDPTGGNHRALWPGDHHMGTARMSKNPEDGIVDPNLKVHSVDNLYLASCAVFPTGGYANPTLTLLALAIRLADHLKRKLGAAA